MARILGVDLPREKRVDIGLTYIYGVGLHTSKKILAAVGIAVNKRVKDLTDEEAASIANFIQNSQDIMAEGDLRREVQQSIKRLMDIGCYRGSRHIRGLPARGQRSKTNARTRKGRKPSVGGRR